MTSVRWGLLLAVPLVLLACDGDDGAARPTPTSAMTTTTSGAPRTTTTAVPVGIPPERGFSTEELSVKLDRAAGIYPYLTDVRLGAGQGYERITFQFEGTFPTSALVWYEEEPFEVSDAGYIVPHPTEGKVLTVSFYGTATRRFSSDPNQPGRPTYTGPGWLRSRDTRLVDEASFSCEAETEVEWAIVVRQPRPFRAMTFSDPPRFVVDIQRAG